MSPNFRTHGTGRTRSEGIFFLIRPPWSDDSSSAGVWNYPRFCQSGFASSVHRLPCAFRRIFLTAFWRPVRLRPGSVRCVRTRFASVPPVLISHQQTFVPQNSPRTFRSFGPTLFLPQATFASALPERFFPWRVGPSAEPVGSWPGPLRDALLPLDVFLSIPGPLRLAPAGIVHGENSLGGHGLAINCERCKSWPSETGVIVY
jgi:hypothetical protein